MQKIQGFDFRGEMIVCYGSFNLGIKSSSYEVVDQIGFNELVKKHESGEINIKTFRVRQKRKGE